MSAPSNDNIFDEINRAVRLHVAEGKGEPSVIRMGAVAYGRLLNESDQLWRSFVSTGAPDQVMGMLIVKDADPDMLEVGNG